MLLSIIIPAQNEAANLPSTVSALSDTLEQRVIEYEIIVVDDHSTDNTAWRLFGAQYFLVGRKPEAPGA